MGLVIGIQIWNQKQTRFPVCDSFFTVIKSVLMQPKPGLSHGYFLLENQRNKGNWMLLYCYFCGRRMLVNIISACGVCIYCGGHWWQLVISSAGSRIDGWLNSEGMTKRHCFTIHGTTLSACIRESICMRSHFFMWNSSTHSLFCMSRKYHISKTQRRCK